MEGGDISLSTTAQRLQALKAQAAALQRSVNSHLAVRCDTDSPRENAAAHDYGIVLARDYDSGSLAAELEDLRAKTTALADSLRLEKSSGSGSGRGGEEGATSNCGGGGGGGDVNSSGGHYGYTGNNFAYSRDDSFASAATTAVDIMSAPISPADDTPRYIPTSPTSPSPPSSLSSSSLLPDDTTAAAAPIRATNVRTDADLSAWRAMESGKAKRAALHDMLEDLRVRAERLGRAQDADSDYGYEYRGNEERSLDPQGWAARDRFYFRMYNKPIPSPQEAPLTREEAAAASLSSSTPASAPASALPPRQPNKHCNPEAAFRAWAKIKDEKRAQERERVDREKLLQLRMVAETETKEQTRRALGEAAHADWVRQKNEEAKVARSKAKRAAQKAAREAAEVAAATEAASRRNFDEWLAGMRARRNRLMVDIKSENNNGGAASGSPEAKARMEAVAARAEKKQTRAHRNWCKKVALRPKGPGRYPHPVPWRGPLDEEESRRKKEAERAAKKTANSNGGKRVLPRKTKGALRQLRSNAYYASNAATNSASSTAITNSNVNKPVAAAVKAEFADKWGPSPPLLWANRQHARSVGRTFR